MRIRLLPERLLILLFVIFLYNSGLFSGEQFKPLEDDASFANNENLLKSSREKVTINVLKSIAAPGLGDSRGLTWDGANLWFSEDDSKLIFKIDTSSGAVLDSIRTPGLSYTEGLAWDGQSIWHAEYNGLLYKIDPSNGTFLDTLTAPTAKPTGLTWDGTYLWAANYKLDSLYQFSPHDGSLINSYASPGSNPWGLTKASNLWNCNLKGGSIYELDPSTCNIISAYSVPANSMYNGLTFDGEHLWVVDNDDDFIKKLDIAVAVSIDDGYFDQTVSGFKLNQNYPNPFNNSTRIDYSLAQGSEVVVTIYDVVGEKIKTIWKGYQAAGNHSHLFNAGNLCSGVYYYRLVSRDYNEVRKMLLVK